jgi:hypothetical protein
VRVRHNRAAHCSAVPFEVGQRVIDAEVIRGSVPWWKVNSLEEWLARAEALPAQSRALSDDIAALLALKGLDRDAADQAEPDTLSRAASALLVLAQHAAAARSRPDDNQCNVCRAAHLLGSVLQQIKPLSGAVKKYTGFRGAVVALLDTAACEDVTYKNEVMISQVASAQVYLARACPSFWRRMHEENRFGDLPARQGSNLLWVRARLFSDELMTKPSEEMWAVMCSFLPTVAEAMMGHDLSNTLWAGATIGHSYQGDLAELLLAAIQRLSPSLEAQTVATTIWAVARMRWDGRREELQTLYAAIRRVHTDVDPSGLSQLLGGLADLRVSVSPEDREAVFAATSRLSTELASQQVANIIVYLGRLPWPVPDDVMRGLLDATRRTRAKLLPIQLPQLLLGLAWLSAPGRARVAVPVDVQAQVLHLLDRDVPHLSGSHTTDCLKMLGRLFVAVTRGPRSKADSKVHRRRDTGAEHVVGPKRGGWLGRAALSSLE